MRKAISTIVLALGLVFAGAPVVHASGYPDTCPGTGQTTGPCAPMALVDAYQESLEACNATVAEQAVEIAALRNRIDEQATTIRHQRAVIKRLRHRLERR